MASESQQTSPSEKSIILVGSEDIASRDRSSSEELSQGPSFQSTFSSPSLSHRQKLLVRSLFTSFSQNLKHQKRMSSNPTFKLGGVSVEYDLQQTQAVSAVGTFGVTFPKSKRLPM